MSFRLCRSFSDEVDCLSTEVLVIISRGQKRENLTSDATWDQQSERVDFDSTTSVTRGMGPFRQSVAYLLVAVGSMEVDGEVLKVSRR